jgi:hypothetical protein
MLDLVVNDLGFSRARVAVRSGAEGGGGTTYNIVNDNADPNVINASGFTFTTLNTQMDKLVMPMRQRVLARGLPFYFNLEYVDFGASSFEHYNNPEEYAEFMLATFQHLKSRYNVIPTGIEVILEPDNISGWSGEAIGKAIVATAAKLQANGFAVPEFIGPATTSMPNALGYLEAIISVPGAQALLTEVAYHRYNMAGDLSELAARATQLGKRMSMLEYWGAGTDSSANSDMLLEDLTTGRNASWQQGPPVSTSCNWGPVVAFINGTAQPCPLTKTIRQYTKHVRPGAQRIDSVSQNPSFDPVAFVNADGQYVVVVRAESAGSFSVSNLPGGTYGVFYTTSNQYDVNVSNVTISNGQVLSANIPDAGVITIYKK